MKLDLCRNSPEAALEFGVFHWVLNAPASLPGLLPSGHPSAEFFEPALRAQSKDVRPLIESFERHLIGWHTKIKDPLVLCSGGVDSSTLVATAAKEGIVLDLLHTAYVNHDNNDLEKLARLLETFPARARVFSIDAPEYLLGMEQMRARGCVQNTYAPTITCALAAANPDAFRSLVTGSGPDELFYGMEKYTLDYFESRSAMPIACALEEIDTPYNIVTYRRVLNVQGLALLEAVLEKRRNLYRAIEKICRSILDAQRMLAYCTVTSQHMDLFDGIARDCGLVHAKPFLHEDIIKAAFAVPVQELFNPDRTDSRVEAGKFHLKRFLARYMSKDHVFSRKIGFHAPTTRFIHSAAFRPLIDRLPYDRLPSFFDKDKLRAEVTSRLQTGPDKSSRDYFLYSLLQLGAVVST